jgi:hypothetical protein
MRPARPPNSKAQASLVKRISKRSGAGLAGIILAVALSSASAQAKLPEPIYFFSNVASTIKMPGMPVQGEVIRPSKIGLFADGSWYLEKLRWTEWGSKVAHATAISSASNGIPSQAQGKRIKTPARITLSSPGRFFGREVYRCYQLKVRRPATDAHGCLAGAKGYWYLTGI